jgi:ABC-type sugar transport system ATPase subunit
MTASEISELVTGATIEEFVRTRRSAEEPAVVLDGFVPSGQQPVDLMIGRGEIVGFVGLPGSGARETARAIAGLHPNGGGSVTVNGSKVRTRSVRSAMTGGVAYLTDDRIGEGIVGPFSVRESLRLGNWPVRHGFVDRKKLGSCFASLHERLAFRVSGPDQPIEELSGGNQQKILFGRLLELRPQLLILDEPTLGVDVKTKDEVHRLVDEFTAQGHSVILLAYDTDEMVHLVDRVVAFQDGYVSRELTGDQITPDEIVACLHHDTEPREPMIERAV